MMKQVKAILTAVLFLTLPFVTFGQRNDGAVIPGDFADPSIIKVGNTYYAVGTSSEWAPHFPIFKSADLKTWKQTGYVFNKTPEWASGSFWAPEYYKIKDTYYIYYTARRKSDNTSYIGVATSKFPDKDFTDHGVLIPYGKEAIDGFVFEDGGQLYITFKAYGLDKRPIELLCYKLSADGLKLEGEPFSLMRDDQKLGMEGESILKRDGYYYIFYSAGNCCGVRCTYNVRVARAKNFAGPYEVYANNPILFENDKWTCMGHGTFVKGPNGRDFYIHHAYNKQSMAITGRQGLVSELIWPQQGGWPVFKTQEVMGKVVADVHEKFGGSKVANNWQWDFRNATPIIYQQGGALTLSGSVKPGNNTGIVITDRPVSGSFEINTVVLNQNAALKGLAFYGDANEAVGVGTQNKEVIVWQVHNNKYTILAQATMDTNFGAQLKMEVNNDKTCRFYYMNRGKEWIALTTETPVKINNLPQWDRSPRVGLHFKGPESLNARFSGVRILNK